MGDLCEWHLTFTAVTLHCSAAMRTPVMARTLYRVRGLPIICGSLVRRNFGMQTLKEQTKHRFHDLM